jgi:hypothetical protein
MNTPQTPQASLSSWYPLRRELVRRVREPASQVSYVIFFLLGILGISGLGIWFECCRALLNAADSGKQPILNAIYTYFPAVAGASAFQMIIGEPERFLRSFAILLMALVFILAMVLLLGIAGSNGWAFTVSAFAVVLSWFAWWIANADEPGLTDIRPDSTLGGSTTKAPSGSTEGFNV